MSHEMFVPLELDLIDEGRFQKDLNDALLKSQEQLIQHVRKYGSKADKSKAVVNMQIGFVYDGLKEAYGCVAQIKTVMPAVPAVASLLHSGEDQTGQKRLMCRVSGANKDAPSQARLCTDDGRTVNTDTGEVTDV